MLYTCKTKGGTVSVVEGRSKWHIKLNGTQLDGEYLTAKSAMQAVAGKNARLPLGHAWADWDVPSGASGWLAVEDDTGTRP